MHVLILGANGMLGRALADVFADDDVTPWDREHLDLRDERAVIERLPFAEPDLVVNAAAFTDVDKAEKESDEADAVNGYAVGNLAVTCAEADIPLLHVSTDYVFDGRKPDGYAENDEPERPVNAYGRSKLLGETLLKENGAKYWLVRTAWLYGAHGNHFVKKIARAAASASTLSVVGDQVGSPTYARDLAFAIQSLVRDRAPYGIYHLVNSGTASRADVAETVARLLRKDIRIERVSSDAYPTPAARPRWSVLKNTKRPPLRPWAEALTEYLRET